MQALEEHALQPVAETLADPHSNGFRPHRSTADAIDQCFISLSQKHSAQWILEADIRGCFDNISHQWLLENIPMDKTILKCWLKAGYIEDGTLFSTAAGTPQGGIISPVLANMALDGLEKVVLTAYPRKTQGRRSKLHVIRYADDFVITADSPDILEQYVKPAVIRFLAERGLTLSEEKTKVTHIEQGFDFLGHNLRKYRGKLLIKPSRKSIKTFLDKVRSAIRRHKQAQQVNLIRLLNPIIRGWVQYYRHVVSANVYKKIDQTIWQALWRWAKRRHNNKGARWVLKRYFHPIGNLQLHFAAGRRIGTSFLGTRLFHATQVAIVRHVKIKSEATAFDPRWESYLAKRKRKHPPSELPGSLLS